MILFPELGLWATDDERRAAWRRAFRTCGNRPQVVLGALVSALVAGSLVQLGKWMSVYGASELRSYAIELVFAGIGGASGGLVFAHLVRRVVRRELRADLARRGLALCVNCGYDLRGQQELRCPECGTPFAV